MYERNVDPTVGGAPAPASRPASTSARWRRIPARFVNGYPTARSSGGVSMSPAGSGLAFGVAPGRPSAPPDGPALPSAVEVPPAPPWTPGWSPITWKSAFASPYPGTNRSQGGAIPNGFESRSVTFSTASLGTAALIGDAVRVVPAGPRLGSGPGAPSDRRPARVDFP